MFGSVLRDDFHPDSDVDVLVEFEPGHTPGFAFIDIQDQLSEMLGRQVDLNIPQDLSRYFRNQVIEEAEALYAQTDEVRLRYMLDTARKAIAFTLIWDIVTSNLPPLIEQLKLFLENK